MASKILINQGSEVEYEPSDSENEYTQHEKKLLNKARKKRRPIADEKEEVMGFADSDSEDGHSLVNNSDFDEEDNNIPDSKAWGKKRATYYNTDFVDQDYSTYNEKEEQLAYQEEEDAKQIQQRLAKQLDEADFTVDFYSGDTHEKKLHLSTDKLKPDLSDVSVRQKEQLFVKDSPEFAGLVEDFKRHLHKSDSLSPIIEYAKNLDLQLPAVEFAKLRNNITLSYCTNISFYLLLKSKRINVKNHPVVKRLVHLRHLLDQLDGKFEKVVKSQIEVLRETINSGLNLSAEANTTVQVHKKLKVMQLFDNSESVLSNSVERYDAVLKEENTDDDGLQVNVKRFGDDSDDRRGIPYQIAKNKGLTPHRKKELRNPRVKHRQKYRKALVRRKGAVRAVRTELKRYGGEISGIKATVKKSIKIKS